MMHGGHVASTSAGSDERFRPGVVVADPAVAAGAHAAHQGICFHILENCARRKLT